MDEEKILTAKVCCDLAVIDEHLDNTALLLGVAEEASEVIQAVMKMLRASDAVFNPTPVTLEEAEDELRAELKDLLLVLFVAGVDIENLLREAVSGDNEKISRWAERIKAAKYK